MGQSFLQGSVTLRKLRTGQTAQIVLSCTKQLFQLYMEENGKITVAPDWEDTPANRPKCSVKVNSSNSKLTITDVTWKINGTTVDSSIGTTDSSDFSLTIIKNLVEKLNKVSGTLTAVVSFVDANGNQQTVEKSEPIRIQRAVDSTYYVMVNASTTTVDAGTSAVLTAQAFHGIKEYTIDGSSLKIKWFKGVTSTTELSSNIGNSATGKGDQLTVGADDVAGSTLFVARLYNNSNEELDAEGVRITDASDTYRIMATATPYISNVAQTPQKNFTKYDASEEMGKVLVTFAVVDSEGTAYTGTVSSWEVQKFHSSSLKLIGGSSASNADGYTTDTDEEDPSSDGGSGNTSSSNQIMIYDCDYNLNGAIDEVIVTATASL